MATRSPASAAMSSVSVIIPCYQYAHFLEQCVASVLDQRGVDVRVLVIDDASPDDSASVAHAIASRDQRVEVSVHRENKGNIATFNEGLMEWADGDYCLLLSADDRLTPGALRRAADLLDANPNVGFTYGHAIWWVDTAAPPVARTTSRGWGLCKGSRWLERRFAQAENPIISPEIVVRTSLQKRVGGYDPSLPKAADFEIYMRYAAHGDVGFLRGVDQAYYRVHGSNMSKSVSAVMDLRQRRTVFDVAVQRYRDALPDPDALSALARRRLSQEALWAAGRMYAQGRSARWGRGSRLIGSALDGTERDVDDLLAFAVDCWEGVERLSLYRDVAARRKAGPRAMSYMVDQQAQWWLRRRLWKYRGW